jgi:hypothetical protein
LVLFVWLIKIKITCLKAIEMLREINADIDTSIENYRRHKAEADAKVQLRQGSGA